MRLTAEDRKFVFVIVLLRRREDVIGKGWRDSTVSFEVDLLGLCLKALKDWL